MIAGIMQPYLLPYLEQFRLIAACDLWVVFDTVAYRRRSWMNRNRIVDRTKGWTYFSVPVTRGEHDEPVADVRIADPDHWRSKLIDRFRVYEHEAPYYGETLELLQRLVEPAHDRLVDLDVASLRCVSEHLGIDTEIVRLSELRLDLPGDCEPGEWALEISKRVGATEYRNPSGGRDIFDPRPYRDAGIELTFHEHRELHYDTGSFEFVDGLSVIDPLMWLGRGAARHLG